jgi:hypothetical protein
MKANEDIPNKTIPEPTARSGKARTQEFPNRRTFIRAASASVAVGVVGLPLSSSQGLTNNRETATGHNPRGRRAKQAYEIRVAAASRQSRLPLMDHPTNGDEQLYSNKIANFSKGLPHNTLGQVNARAYESLKFALTTRDPADFEKIILGNVRKLVNPQAGLAFEMQGPDSHTLSLRPPPAFSSAEQAGEIAENYWMALTRDIPFSEYDTNPLVQQAMADLSKFSDFRGPKIKGQITPATLFRADASGVLVGPYISQFLLADAPFGAERVDRRIRTARPGFDYLIAYDEWLTMQNGNTSWPDQIDPVLRYVRNARDLGQWVHYDVLFQAYLDAMLVLFSIGARRGTNNPYQDSRTQVGFGTYGNTHVGSVLCAVTKPALKAVWYQKWFVHRRLRPEEFAGHIHNHVTGATHYPIHADILNSQVLDEVFKENGTYLLPQAFPEGAPTHPAYGAGHATVAGACVTILKAFFDESFIIRGPVEASPDGNTRLPYEGPPLTVGGELNKLAYNIALGRNMAGVHWRTDAEESLKLGEQVAIRYLQEERDCMSEKSKGFTLTKFDGSSVII